MISNVETLETNKQVRANQKKFLVSSDESAKQTAEQNF